MPSALWFAGGFAGEDEEKGREGGDITVIEERERLATDPSSPVRFITYLNL